MPQKLRSKKAEPKLLSKNQILREYELSNVTWDWLEQSQVLQLPRSSRPGRVKYEVDAEASKILRMARNHVASFPGYRPPCLRYLLWAFLVMPLDDILDDLTDRNIINRSIGHREISSVLLRFMEVLPPSIAQIVKNQEEPKTTIQERDFDALLKITGLFDIYYNKKIFMEYVYFPSEDAAHMVNQVILTTGGSNEAKCKVLEHDFGKAIFAPEGLATYRNLFMDFSVCDEKSWLHYTKGYKPSVKIAYRKAVDMTTKEFVLVSQLDGDDKKFLGLMRSRLRDQLLVLADSAATEDKKMFTHMLGTYVKVNEHEAKLLPGLVDSGPGKGGNIPTYYQDATLGETGMDYEDDWIVIREESDEGTDVAVVNNERNANHRS